MLKIGHPVQNKRPAVHLVIHPIKQQNKQRAGMAVIGYNDRPDIHTLLLIR